MAIFGVGEEAAFRHVGLAGVGIVLVGAEEARLE
jgi:hypothetical protein